MLLVVQLVPSAAYAQTPTGFERICPRYVDGNGDPVFPVDGVLPAGAQRASIGNCVAKIYVFALGAGGLVALLMIILAGYRYMTASGNAESVSKAKDGLQSAFTGLIIIFIGFILLYLINPELVQFKNINSSLPPLNFEDGELVP